MKDVVTEAIAEREAKNKPKEETDPKKKKGEAPPAKTASAKKG